MNTQNLTIQELVPLIQEWAKKRDIFDKSTPFDQLLKTHEEVGELIKACYDNDRPAIQDAIGDVMVTLINYCYFIGEDFIFAVKLSESRYCQTLLRTNLRHAIKTNEALTIILIEEDYQREVPILKKQIIHIVAMLIANLHCIALLENTTLEECLNIAYNEIKNRKGKIINGKFIKNGKTNDTKY